MKVVAGSNMPAPQKKQTTRLVDESRDPRKLLPDGAKLDFSPINHCKYSSVAKTAAPLASACEFSPGNDELALLHILSSEMQFLQVQPSEPTFLGLLKDLVLGISDSEYLQRYPWSSYVQEK